MTASQKHTVEPYLEPPQFGERRPENQPDPREAWWGQVADYAKTQNGDFVELKSCPVAWNTINGFKRLVKNGVQGRGNSHDRYRVPAVFYDPMFQIERYGGKVYIRYIPD